MKFMNLNKWLYSNPQEEAGGGEQGGGAGGGEQGGQEQAGAPQIDYDALAAAMLKAQKAGEPKGDGYKDHLNDEEKAKQKKAETKKLESAIKFNNSFADTVTKYKKNFPERTAQLLTRQFDSETDKAEQLQKFAAKDFFLNEDNLSLLPPAQQLEVKAHLTAEHEEITMSGDQAWRMVETALYMLDQKQDRAKMNGMYSTDSDDTPENVAKFHDRIYGKKSA